MAFTDCGRPVSWSLRDILLLDKYFGLLTTIIKPVGPMSDFLGALKPLIDFLDPLAVGGPLP